MSMKRINSVVTTPAKEAPSSTSTSLTGAGAIEPLTGEQIEQGLARLLELASPHEVDRRLLISLESHTGYPVREISRTRFTDTDYQTIVQRYEITCTDIDGLDRAITAVRKALVPLPRNQIEDQLTMLATVVVKPSMESSEDQLVRIESLASLLHEYPADIVLYAIERVTKTSKFWPSFAEFYQHIDWMLAKRNLMLRALESKRVALTAQLQ